MNPRTKAALLWGLVGGLAFLVLVQGYELLTSEGVDALVKLVVALLVAVVSAGSSHLAYHRWSFDRAAR